MNCRVPSIQASSKTQNVSVYIIVTATSFIFAINMLIMQKFTFQVHFPGTNKQEFKIDRFSSESVNNDQVIKF